MNLNSLSEIASASWRVTCLPGSSFIGGEFLDNEG